MPDDAPNELKFMVSRTISNVDCLELVGENNKEIIPDSTMCSLGSRAGQSTCNGDDGGPLVANGKLIGVMLVYNFPCGRGHPNLYLRVSAFTEWIQLFTGVVAV